MLLQFLSIEIYSSNCEREISLVDYKLFCYFQLESSTTWVSYFKVECWFPRLSVIIEYHTQSYTRYFFWFEIFALKYYFLRFCNNSRKIQKRCTFQWNCCVNKSWELCVTFFWKWNEIGRVCQRTKETGLKKLKIITGASVERNCYNSVEKTSCVFNQLVCYPAILLPELFLTNFNVSFTAVLCSVSHLFRFKLASEVTCTRSLTFLELSQTLFRYLKHAIS